MPELAQAQPAPRLPLAESDTLPTRRVRTKAGSRPALRGSLPVRISLIALALAFLALVVLLPLAAVFAQAMEK